MNIQGTVAFITGGARIGASVALALAGRGADIALAYRRSAREAEETAAAVRASGRRAWTYAADLAEPAQCRRVVETAAADAGRLDVLVNMASIYQPVDLAAMTDEDWRAPQAVDLGASFACAHAAAPIMRRQGGGRIVNFTDWVAASGRPRYHRYVSYYVAKAGVIALTQALALELASDQILVNAVAPGPILAPPGTTDEEREAVEKATPLGRWGGAEEIAKAVVFLVETDFVTGETIRVDGGRHVK